MKNVMLSLLFMLLLMSWNSSVANNPVLPPSSGLEFQNRNGVISISWNDAYPGDEYKVVVSGAFTETQTVKGGTVTLRNVLKPLQSIFVAVYHNNFVFFSGSYKCPETGSSMGPCIYKFGKMNTDYWISYTPEKDRLINIVISHISEPLNHNNFTIYFYKNSDFSGLHYSQSFIANSKFAVTLEKVPDVEYLYVEVRANQCTNHFLRGFMYATLSAGKREIIYFTETNESGH